MTDCDELVKLADRLAALPTFKMETVVTVPGVACDERERDLIVAALRRLASSDSGVKVRELEWQERVGVDCTFDANTSIGHYIATITDDGRGMWFIVGQTTSIYTIDDIDVVKAEAYLDYETRIRSALVEVPAVKGEPEPVAWPANLNPRTLDLIQRFALALAKKLRLAEEKYGHTDGWSRDDWEAECRDHLYQHLEKGDPRDVAAYCAFMWHHGWITYRPATTTPSDNEKIKRAVRLLDQFDRDATIGIGISTMLRSALGATGQRGAAPPADAGMRPTTEDILECISAELTVTAESWTGGPSGLADGDDVAEYLTGTVWANLATAIDALTAPGATTKSDGGGFQDRVQPWMLACFGPVIPFDKTERNHRFLEEALELVQSIGCTQSEAHQLVDYVFGRPVGDPVQEVGGVMVTLAALCLANDLDMALAGETELARIWTKVEAIRAKQAAKPKHSPLPGPSDPSSTRSDVTALADIAKERQRQREVEGWTPEHDDGHHRGEIARAAAAYALGSQRVLITTGGGSRPLRRQDTIGAQDIWPWSDEWWKPKTPRENLVRAGALIVAEIERLDRLETHQIRRK